MTWAADDSQLTTVCDGFGWEGMPGYIGDSFSSRIFRIEGDAPNHRFVYLPDYPDLPNDFSSPCTYNRYYGFGLLAVDGVIYNFLSTLRGPGWVPDNAFIGTKLIYSEDNGKTWKNQDGSQPVVWERWDDRSRDNMVFFYEPDATFSLLAVLQMGQDYRDNQDGYVYVYAPNGVVDGKMNQLVMLRVPKQSVRDRSKYEYFAALDANGSASWSSDINERGVVCTFPEGYVYEPGETRGTIAYGWHPSVVYNKPLDTYIMVNWGNGTGVENKAWFEEPTYLGFWAAPKPWGPWTQVHEEKAWLPGGRADARPYQPQISPKWISNDGRAFWLVWADFRDVGGALPLRECTAENLQEHLPEYGFNCQKVLIHTEDQ